MWYFFSPSLSLVCFGKLLRKHIVNIMKVYTERNNLQVELKRYHKKVDFIHVYFCKAADSMQYRPPNAYQEVSNTNHFGFVSGSLRRLAVVSLTLYFYVCLRFAATAV